MPSPRYKVISFDLDDALYDNPPVLARAEQASALVLEKAFAEQGQEFEVEHYLSIRKTLLATKTPDLENMSLFRQRALQILCQPLANRQAIEEAAFQAFINARSEIQVQPEIIGLLTRLKRDFILVSASNGNCNVTQTELGQFFQANYSPTQGLRAKPHPQMLECILSDLQLRTSELIHIGDSQTKDGGAATSAGVAFYRFAPFEADVDLERACKGLVDYLYLSR